jgi:LacI family transcriptional regulator
MPNRLDAVAQSDHLFKGKIAPTAAVCYNDAVALGLMLGLHQRGLQPGNDFALTGFDDIAEAGVSAPPLTTLAVTPRDRGRQAAELILQRVQDPSSPSRQTIAPAQLLVRASSCPPHA